MLKCNIKNVTPSKDITKNYNTVGVRYCSCGLQRINFLNLLEVYKALPAFILSAIVCSVYVIYENGNIER